MEVPALLSRVFSRKRRNLLGRMVDLFAEWESQGGDEAFLDDENADAANELSRAIMSLADPQTVREALSFPSYLSQDRRAGMDD